MEFLNKLLDIVIKLPKAMWAIIAIVIVVIVIVNSAG